jgi:hypothetical protein
MKWRPGSRTVVLALLTAAVARAGLGWPLASANTSEESAAFDAEIATPASIPTLPLITATPSPTPSNLLPAPTNLTAAMSPGRDAVTLSWTAPTSASVVAYRILLYESGTRQLPLREVPGSQVQVTLPGLHPRLGYAFVVAAVDQWGRQGLLSAPVNTGASATMTPRPTPTWSPYIPRPW